MVLLRDIHRNYDTDKGTDHNYINTYEELFSPMQNAPINLLEVGVLSGGSLKMFHEYFTAATIYGLDNFIQTSGFGGKTITRADTEASLKEFARIKLLVCDSSSNQSVQSSIPGNMLFNIIIDDGDHTPSAQINTFNNLFPFWSKSGIYIIEDVSNAAADAIATEIQKKYNVNASVRRFNVAQRGDDVLIIVTHRIL